MKSPFEKLLESFLLIINQMSDILYHPVLLFRNGSCLTEVNEELRWQELDPEQTLEEQKEDQGYNKRKSKKISEEQEEHYHEEAGWM